MPRSSFEVNAETGNALEHWRLGFGLYSDRISTTINDLDTSFGFGKRAQKIAHVKSDSRFCSKAFVAKRYPSAALPGPTIATLYRRVHTVLAKHSKSFSLIDCISVGVDRI